MIHYALRCGEGHEFDGWFPSSAGFEAQAGARLLACPFCASCEVGRALMAPRISPRAQGSRAQGSRAQGPLAISEAAAQAPSPESAAPTAEPARPMPDQMRAVLARIRTEIEARCEYVGPRFASVVRRMAESDKPARSVYGEATAEEAAALADDGIEVACIPWVPRADS